MENFSDPFAGFRYDSSKYEKKRIQVLQHEREHIQQKTYKKWMNSILIKAKMEVNDIFSDLSDGQKLFKLLELISGENLGKLETPRLRVHKLDNICKCLSFIRSKVRIESIGAEDIVDGNKRLILGLIWTIILRFQIQNLEIEDMDECKNLSAKEALLLWCQIKTAKYPNVNVKDFGQSWRSGMALNALIHSYCPHIIDFDRLDPNNNVENLNYAFDAAFKHLGVPKLLDAEDLDTERPDEYSIMTYLSTFYHTLSKLRTNNKCGKRVSNIIQQVIDIEYVRSKYEYSVTNLLNWIKAKTDELNARVKYNTLQCVQKQLNSFKNYRTDEKTLKYNEFNECEALYIELQIKKKSLTQSSYVPPEDMSVNTIEKEWRHLEIAENQRELYLRKRLSELEKLENIAKKFEHKCTLRKTYLKEKIKLLSDLYDSSDVIKSETFAVKYKSICVDIISQTEKINNISAIVEELINNDYHNIDEIKRRGEHILSDWQYLLDLLKIYEKCSNDAIEGREEKLTAAAKIHRFNRDVAEALHRIQQKFDIINNIDYGKDLNCSQSLIRKHEVFENDLVALEAQLQVLVDDSVRLQSLYPGGNAKHIVEQQNIVIEHWQALQLKSNQTKQALQHNYHEFDISSPDNAIESYFDSSNDAENSELQEPFTEKSMVNELNDDKVTNTELCNEYELKQNYIKSDSSLNLNQNELNNEEYPEKYISDESNVKYAAKKFDDTLLKSHKSLQNIAEIAQKLVLNIETNNNIVDTEFESSNVMISTQNEEFDDKQSINVNLNKINIENNSKENYDLRSEKRQNETCYEEYREIKLLNDENHKSNEVNSDNNTQNCIEFNDINQTELINEHTNQNDTQSIEPVVKSLKEIKSSNHNLNIINEDNCEHDLKNENDLPEYGMFSESIVNTINLDSIDDKIRIEDILEINNDTQTNNQLMFDNKECEQKNYDNIITKSENLNPVSVILSQESESNTNQSIINEIENYVLDLVNDYDMKNDSLIDKSDNINSGDETNFDGLDQINNVDEQQMIPLTNILCKNHKINDEILNVNNSVIFEDIDNQEIAANFNSTANHTLRTDESVNDLNCHQIFHNDIIDNNRSDTEVKNESFMENISLNEIIENEGQVVHNLNEIIISNENLCIINEDNCEQDLISGIKYVNDLSNNENRNILELNNKTQNSEQLFNDRYNDNKPNKEYEHKILDDLISQNNSQFSIDEQIENLKPIQSSQIDDILFQENDSIVDKNENIVIDLLNDMQNETITYSLKFNDVNDYVEPNFNSLNHDKQQLNQSSNFVCENQAFDDEIHLYDTSDNNSVYLEDIDKQEIASNQANFHPTLNELTIDLSCDPNPDSNNSNNRSDTEVKTELFIDNISLNDILLQDNDSICDQNESVLQVNITSNDDSVLEPNNELLDENNTENKAYIEESFEPSNQFIKDSELNQSFDNLTNTVDNQIITNDDKCKPIIDEQPNDDPIETNISDNGAENLNNNAGLIAQQIDNNISVILEDIDKQENFLPTLNELTIDLSYDPKFYINSIANNRSDTEVKTELSIENNSLNDILLQDNESVLQENPTSNDDSVIQPIKELLIEKNIMQNKSSIDQSFESFNQQINDSELKESVDNSFNENLTITHVNQILINEDFDDQSGNKEWINEENYDNEADLSDNEVCSNYEETNYDNNNSDEDLNPTSNVDSVLEPNIELLIENNTENNANIEESFEPSNQFINDSELNQSFDNLTNTVDNQIITNDDKCKPIIDEQPNDETYILDNTAENLNNNTNIIAQLMDCDRSQLNYELFTTNLLNWLHMKIVELDDRKLANSLEGIQREFLKFKEYRTIEKPPKYLERSEIEALLFKIQTQMKALGQPVYMPTEGKLVQDIEKAWTGLEKAEYKREVALREELLRLEKLENLAFGFERKSVLREGYLKEMIQVLNDPRYGSNLTQVEATVKKHEAISADILARSDRFQNLRLMAQQLINGNYHSSARIVAREEQISGDWKQLLALLAKHQNYLTAASSLMSSLREVNTIRNEIKEIEKSLSSDSNVAVHHLLAVEDLLQRHTLLEAHIASHEDTIRKLNSISNNLKNDDMVIIKEVPLLSKELSILNNEYKNLIELARKKREKLEEMRAYYQFVQDIEEEETTISERQRICQAILPSKDLLGVISLQQKHSVLESEIKAHKNRLKKVIDSGEALIGGKHAEMNNILSRIENLKSQWNHLQELSAQKSKQLTDAIEAFQYHADANEAESWMKEKMQLITSEDYGNSETSALALLQRHWRLESEIRAYEQDIKRLDNQSDKMVKSGIASLFVICGDAFSAATAAGSNEIEDLKELPIEEWVDELIEREVIEDVFEPISIPLVRALYPFTGQDNFAINKGEQMILLEKTNNDWWSVRKERDRRDGFVPANYVQEIEPKIVKKLVQKPVKVWEKQKVKKMLNKKPPKKTIKRNSKRRLSIICDAESVEQRKKNIDSTYDELCELCKIRKQYLEDSIQYFRFNRECDSFDAWMKETEKAMLDTTRNYYQQQNESQSQPTTTTTTTTTITTIAITDPIEILRKKFSNFITELSANRSRVDEIDRMALEFTSSGTQRYLSAIKQRQNEIHIKWDKLNKLMNELGLNVEGLTTVELFNTTCDETVEWMLEKLNKIEGFSDFGKDLKTVQALHRRHDNIERELSPIEEKFTKVNILADSVKSSFPTENNNVIQRQKELKQIWEKVKERANERRAKLDESLGLQVLKNSSKDLLNWIRNYVKHELNNDDIKKAKDVSTVEILLKQHEDLGKEIFAHNEEFNDLRLLAKQLIKQMLNNEVIAILNELNEEQEAIHRGWQEKNNWLRQCKDLMIFNQEADYLDAHTNSHESIIDSNSNSDETLDDCLALIKSHDNLIATLLAQDERLHVLNDMSEKLIDAKHYDSQAIDRRRKSVIERRVLVKEKALKRKRELNDLLLCSEFIADCEDFLNWCSEKRKIAMIDRTESYKDLVNVNVKLKLKKHIAFEAELLSNESRLSLLNSRGNELLMRLSDDRNSEKIDSILVLINNNWQQLVSQTSIRGKCLRQTNDQLNYKSHIEEAQQRVTELYDSLCSKQYGNDLRSCKQLQTKHQNIENEVEMCRERIRELVEIGQQMSETHFDGNEFVLNLCKGVCDAFEKIESPLNERKLKLEAKYNYLSFEFEVNAELQWIREHIPSASSTDYGQNLTDVQNLLKKFQQNLEREIEGHKPLIEKTLKTGSELNDNNNEINGLIKQLMDSWHSLIELALKRKAKLELSLKMQQLLSEANEVELWMNEKLSILSNGDLGRDCDSVVKLLTKHKAIELEIDTYSGLISEMKSMSNDINQLCQSRMQDIEQQMNRLQRLSNQRRLKLIESKSNHEFFRETQLFLIWIGEQMQMASSEDYGQDYEHLLIIQSKFIDFKRKVETNQQTYDQLSQLSAKLTKNEINENIEKRMSKVCRQWNRLLDAIEGREEKLTAAAKIHRFNRDVAEALHRIQQKFDIINNIDYGKDLNCSQSLIRKHEVFENDLVALEAQLQVLVDDSVRLQSLYPGGNAKHIVEQQNIVIEHWQALQLKSNQTKQALQHNYRVFHTMAQIRDLSQWAAHLIQLQDCTALYQSIRDPQSAQLIKLEHQTIKSEIETRETTFNSIVQNVEQITQNNDNCYSNQIDLKAQLNKLLHTRQLLHTSWQMKQLFLDQLIDLNLFLRDVKQLEQLTSQQEINLISQDLGHSVEEVEANIRKHEAFEKLVNSHDEKLLSVEESGIKLIKQNHFDSETVKQKLDEITAKRCKLKEVINQRRLRLIDALILSQFTRDITEAENWIETKFKQLESDHFNHQKVNSLDDKMKKLQKHQTFEAELSAHKTNINEIKQKGDHLIAKSHELSLTIRSQLEHLLNKWNQLLHASEQTGRGLEEAQDILEFSQQVDKVESWIRDKQLLIQHNDTGEDYEHCLALQRKLDDVDSDMRVDETRIKLINILADKLLRQQTNEISNNHQRRREELNQNWKLLQISIDSYRNKLQNALEVHRFNRDLQDLDERISEKCLILEKQEEIKNLQSVEALQRKQDKIEREINAIEVRLKETNNNILDTEFESPNVMISTQNQEFDDKHSINDDLNKINIENSSHENYDLRSEKRQNETCYEEYREIKLLNDENHKSNEVNSDNNTQNCIEFNDINQTELINENTNQNNTQSIEPVVKSLKEIKSSNDNLNMINEDNCEHDLKNEKDLPEYGMFSDSIVNTNNLDLIDDKIRIEDILEVNNETQTIDNQLMFDTHFNISNKEYEQTNYDNIITKTETENVNSVSVILSQKVTEGTFGQESESYTNQSIINENENYVLDLVNDYDMKNDSLIDKSDNINSGDETNFDGLDQINNVDEQQMIPLTNILCKNHEINDKVLNVNNSVIFEDIDNQEIVANFNSTANHTFDESVNNLNCDQIFHTNIIVNNRSDTEVKNESFVENISLNNITIYQISDQNIINESENEGLFVDNLKEIISNENLCIINEDNCEQDLISEIKYVNENRNILELNNKTQNSEQLFNDKYNENKLNKEDEHKILDDLISQNNSQFSIDEQIENLKPIQSSQIDDILFQENDSIVDKNENIVIDLLNDMQNETITDSLNFNDVNDYVEPNFNSLNHDKQQLNQSSNFVCENQAFDDEIHLYDTSDNNSVILEDIDKQEIASNQANFYPTLNELTIDLSCDPKPDSNNSNNRSDTEVKTELFIENNSLNDILLQDNDSKCGHNESVLQENPTSNDDSVIQPIKELLIEKNIMQNKSSIDQSFESFNQQINDSELKESVDNSFNNNLITNDNQILINEDFDDQPDNEEWINEENYDYEADLSDNEVCSNYEDTNYDNNNDEDLWLNGVISKFDSITEKECEIDPFNTNLLSIRLNHCLEFMNQLKRLENSSHHSNKLSKRIFKLKAICQNEIEKLEQNIEKVRSESSSPQFDDSIEIAPKKIENKFLSYLTRALKASLPIQALMFLLFGAASLIPTVEEDYSCVLRNNFANSFNPMVYFPNGAPPV